MTPDNKIAENGELSNRIRKPYSRTGMRKPPPHWWVGKYLNFGWSGSVSGTKIGRFRIPIQEETMIPCTPIPLPMTSPASWGEKSRHKTSASWASILLTSDPSRCMKGGEGKINSTLHNNQSSACWWFLRWQIEWLPHNNNHISSTIHLTFLLTKRSKILISPNLSPAAKMFPTGPRRIERIPQPTSA